MRYLTFSVLRNCKFKRIWLGARMYSEKVKEAERDTVLPKDTTFSKDILAPGATADPTYTQISESWLKTEEPTLREAVLRDMQVFPNFVSEEEEAAMMKELEPQLKRMRYEFDHWDNAIQGYRETERSQWLAANESVLARVKALAFPPGSGDPLPHVHVLDLAAAGHIKPHVDAVRFCGGVIAGLSLLSSAVMRLEHCEHKHLTLDALLERRSLYIMKDSARYKFSHAVLGGDASAWRGAAVARRRRVAVICRSAPHAQH